MTVTDNDIDSQAKSGWIPLHHSLLQPVATSANRPTFAIVPGFKFEVMKCQAWVNTLTPTVTIDVKVAGVSVLAAPITLLNATDVSGTLVTNKVARRGSSTASLSIEYTNAGAGTFFDGHFTVWIRAYPGNGEV